MHKNRRWTWLAMAALAGCNNTNGMSDGGAPGSVQFTASGEVLALGGYDFPPAAAGSLSGFWQLT